MTFDQLLKESIQEYCSQDKDLEIKKDEIWVKIMSQLTNQNEVVSDS